MKKIERKIAGIFTVLMLLLGPLKVFPVFAHAETEAVETVIQEASDPVETKEDYAEGYTDKEDQDTGSVLNETDVVSDLNDPAVLEMEEEISESSDDGMIFEDSTESSYPAFFDAKTVDGVTVSLSAEEGVFPEGAYLSVESVIDEKRQIADAAVENARTSDVTVAVSYTFDIKVLNQDGNEIQPADGKKVTIEFAASEAMDKNLDVSIYHITEKEAEPLKSSIEGNTIQTETDSFSFFTVEFTYDSLSYTLSGQSTVELDTILNALGLTGEVESAESSAPELFSAEKTDGKWMLYSHQSFDTMETLTVTISGIAYIIEVTDPAEVYPVWFDGEQITSENCDDVCHDGGSVKYDPVTKTMTFNDAKMTHNVPSSTKGLIVVDGITLTISGKADFRDHFLTKDGISLNNGADLIFDNADIVISGSYFPIGRHDGESEVTILNGHVEMIGMNYEGIYTDYVTVIDGTLIAKGTQHGIMALKGLHIKGGYLDTTGIDVPYGDVVIDGGTVSGPIRAGREGYESEGNIYINGGTVLADASKSIRGTDWGLGAYGKIEIGPGITGVIAQSTYAFLAWTNILIDSNNVVALPNPHHITTGINPYGYYKTISASMSTADIAKKVIIVPKGTHCVDFEGNGHGNIPDTTFVKDGDTLSKPEDPSEKGYTFMGWYTDENFTKKYDFSSPVTSDLTLYAHWCANVKGLMIYTDGTEEDGSYYRLKATTLKPLFENGSGEVSIELGHLCTDSSCSDAITEPPVKETTYYFQVYMKDPSSLETGKQLILFLPEIKDNIIRSAVEAKLEFDSITGSPSGDSVILLFKYTEDKITYTITQGADAKWQKGSSKGADYTIERDVHDHKTYSLFESIEVDGTVLASTDYSASSGSLNVTLKPSYLNKLSVGAHTVKFKFKDGTVETPLTILAKPAEPDSSGTYRIPMTGVTGHPYSLTDPAFLHLISLAGLLLYCKKHTK